MATRGSALVCKLRRAFSWEDSEGPRLWLEVPDSFDRDLSDLTLKPRLRPCWGAAILLGPPYLVLASEIKAGLKRL